MIENNYCIVMAGGVGSRFWPFSKAEKPKQFLDFFGMGRSLLQITIDRFKTIIPNENIFVVSNILYRDLILEQLPEIKPEQMLLEPIRRNTAPCIAYAVYKIRKKCKYANILVVPSDHLIFNEIEYLKVLKEGFDFITDNRTALLTLGMKPTRPETGYGYIQITEGETDLRKVKTFTEKPDLEMAKVFLSTGEFFWNSGMFLWNINAIIEAFNEFLPEISQKFEDGLPFYDTDKEEHFIEETYQLCQNISIDYGIMEKSKNVFVKMADFGWSDLGTWQSLYDLGYKDTNSNVSYGCKTKLYNSYDNLIVLPKNQIAVIDGLKGYLIANYNDVLLICPKDNEHKIRQFVADVGSMTDGERFI
jgi:mannose-1-phosphate guanylyltransferase